MISADVKQQEIKELVAASCYFLYNVKASVKLEIYIFHLILLGILSSLRLSVENGAGLDKLILSDVR